MRNRKHGGTVRTEMSIIRNDEDIDVLVSGYYNPEQNGGMTDPSWSAYVEFEEAVNSDWVVVQLTAEEIEWAKEALMEAA